MKNGKWINLKRGLAGAVVGLVASVCAIGIAQTAPKSFEPVPNAAEATKNAALNQRFLSQVQPILTQYCYGCHGNGKKKGDLTLDRFTSLQIVLGEKKVWNNVSDMLEQHSMPPDNKPQPSDDQIKLILNWVDEAVNQIDCTGPRDPGHVAIHRLNRTEYNNTIRDLVGIDFEPAADFPVDDSGYGFDNIADVLTMSPLLAEKYLSATEEIFDKAITDFRIPKSVLVKIAGNQMNTEVGSAAQGSAWNLQTNGQISKRHDFKEGEYEIRVRAWQEAFGDEPAKMTLRIDNKPVKTFDVPALQGKPGTYVIRYNFTAGSHKIATAYINNLVDNKNPDLKKRGDRNLIVDRVEIEGPFNAKAPKASESHKRLFFVMPGPKLSEEAAARQIISEFALRAFRRPVPADETNRLMALYSQAKADAQTFEQSVRVPLTAVLVSPQFLFRIEVDPQGQPGVVHRVSDYELASRLSYFLWSSMPDDELLLLAGQGKLHEPAVQRAQVKRMLADPKSKEFVENFTGQWLELRNLESHQVDAQRFPEFDDKLRAAMKGETETFFANLIKTDGSILDLLGGDYTFVNERLAKLYGIKGIKGEDFQKVSLKGTHRGGVMTMASVLTLTAMPTRTSPVKRGVFVLQNILGTPPPPPPPDVPSLADRPRDEANAPLRERLAKHRADPNCAVCHMRMDGIGFALENFGPVGAYREKEGKFTVDSNGELAGGKKIAGPDGLRELLDTRKLDFVRCLTEKMLTYALGRGMEMQDRCTVRDICLDVAKNDYKFSSLIDNIVMSDAFQKRRSKKVNE